MQHPKPYPTPIHPVITPVTRFAFVGDSGEYPYLNDTQAVANGIKAQNPEFVVHLGDLNYYGDPANLSAHFTNFWTGWLDKIYIAFGNHDLDYDYGEAILNVLPLTNNAIGSAKRAQKLLCYDFVRGPIHFFVFNTGDTRTGDSMVFEYDSNMQLPAQFTELQAKMKSSTSLWKIAVFHKPPYTNAPNHPPAIPMQANWKMMGIDVVLCGHCHNYEYIHKDGVHYFIQGLGGALKHCAVKPYKEPDTITNYCQMNGYTICEALNQSLIFKTYNIEGTMVDHRVVNKKTQIIRPYYQKWSNKI